jgi:hypothetical protein
VGLSALYDLGATIEILDAFSTNTLSSVIQRPAGSPTTDRRDVALELTGATTVRVILTRLAHYVEPQPEALTWLDSGITSFEFVQQLKRLHIDLRAPDEVTLSLYSDEVLRATLTVLPTNGRASRPLPLSAGIRGRQFRATLLSTGAPFLCYTLTGFFKQLGTDTAYQERPLTTGV